MSTPPDPEQHFRTIARCARDGIVTITVEGTIRYANPAIERLFGYEPQELVGRSLFDLMAEDDARVYRDALARYRETGERAFDWDDIRFLGVHRDGREIPVSISISEFEDGGTRYLTGILRDASEQQRRERRLAELNRLAQDLSGAESVEAVCERATTAAQLTLGHPLVTIERYDANAGQLDAYTWTSAVDDLVDDGTLFGADQSLPWQTFVNQEPTIANDLGDAADATPLRSAICYPLGSHGVLVAGSTEPNAFDNEDADTASILVGNTYSALERVDREGTLRNQRDQLAAKTESLDRVRRTNDVIRDLTKVLTHATDREEMLEAICTRLASSYQAAWFGSVDPASGAVEPEAAAGGAAEYLAVLDDGQPGGEPVEQAIVEREVQVRDDLYRDPPFEPWRQAAIERGYHAHIAVPIVYGETRYGVLSLYAGTANGFDRMEVAALQEFGETIGYALNATERKQALTSDRSIELAFDIVGDGALLGLPERAGGSVELENLVERPDGTVTMFVAVPHGAGDWIDSWATDRPEVEAVQLLSERTETALIEATLSDATVWAQLLRRGATVRDATAAVESSRVVIRIPSSADARSFGSLLREYVDEVELVARREYEEPVLTPEEFGVEFRERLTDRQNEVLQTAYYAGYFDWPRETKSGELADLLGIAQPTVSRHLRTSQRRLLSMIYDDPDQL
ncbi:PAS domain S-box protein [Halobacteria archaeon AArc-dxtr1]|nr:PAS domain S-box protein [Halobacteria archaeon AArc-dxtr1]